MDTDESEDEISYENAHPNAQKLMQGEFFYSVTDGTAPFGSDDGWEVFYAFKNWQKTNNGRSKVDFIHEQIDYWGYPTFNLQSTNIEDLKQYLLTSELGSRFMYGIDQAIIATAFGQLYLEGYIDLNLRSLATTAIKRELLPEILNLWQEQRTEREEKLNMLMLVLRPN